MLRVLLFACTTSLAAAQSFPCSTNADGTCYQAENATCVSECSRRLYAASCQTTSGCSWNATAKLCSPVDPAFEEMCSNQPSSAGCAGVAGCHWKLPVCTNTLMCVAKIFNVSNPTQCNGATDATSCAALGSNCQIQEKCKARCGCQETPGCFAYDYSYPCAGECATCFEDPDVNLLELYRSLAGLRCTDADGNLVISVYQVFAPAANAGCEGGKKFTKEDIFGNVTCTTLPGMPPKKTSAASSTFAAATTAFAFAFAFSLFLA